MTVRTCVLAACMIVVPGLALCSHHLPAEVRALVRCDVWQPWAARAKAWLADDSGLPAAAGPAEQPPDAPAVTPLAQDKLAAGQERANERLAALGAVAVECRSLEGTADLHLASCRVAMDAAGQLHRVFQAAGPSPTAAIAALADEVEAWRARWAARAGEAATPAVSL